MLFWFQLWLYFLPGIFEKYLLVFFSGGGVNYLYFYLNVFSDEDSGKENKKGQKLKKKKKKKKKNRPEQWALQAVHAHRSAKPDTFIRKLRKCVRTLGWDVNKKICWHHSLWYCDTACVSTVDKRFLMMIPQVNLFYAVTQDWGIYPNNTGSLR